jgi:hypothetical protein
MIDENQEVKSAGLRSSQPVFLIGFYRSGTSLLHALLSQHPQMALMYECNVWDFPRVFSKIRFQKNWLERLEFLNKALSRHRLIFGGSLRGLENVRTPEELYHAFTEVKGAAFWGEKSPAYGTRLRQLARRYPGCSFILIWRDPLEIYRSIVQASREARFFRRPGMLNRFIFDQEQMIRQVTALSRNGGRIHHVTYDDLIDKTENTCRGICRFLEIEFDEKMLDLAHADFSVVFPPSAQHHDHLQRGVIERQPFFGETLSAPIARKLRRFRSRWNRFRSKWAEIQEAGDTGTGPSLVERFYHHLAGLFFHSVDVGRRILLEFLPLPWLRTYRQAKNWFLAQHATPTDEPSLREQFSTHSITILTSCAVLAGVATIDYLTGPNVTVMPFYLIPPAILTLIINFRWGTLGATASAVVWSMLRTLDHPNLSSHYGLFLWNCAMRLLLLQIIVLLLNRIRIEITTADSEAD